MGCKTEKTNFHVVVYPGETWASFPGMRRSAKEEERLCLEIIQEIKRHVDNTGYIGVENDTEASCEFCGSGWTEDEESLHNGGCCTEDCKAYYAEYPEGGGL